MTDVAGFGGRTAIITGGASGIGLALATELARGGARVVLADLDGDGAAAAAEAVSAVAGRPSLVAGQALDVRDREAVQALVDDVAARHGAIDFLFNNAGISIGGPTHELSGAHWDRIIDVNLRGVVNGVLAGYPRMIEQGHGHIVNTASAAGLVATPLAVPYATTKHAVVGLSTGLRPEAALHGVRVSVLCPGAVDTPILDRPPPEDLPATASATVTARRYLEQIHQKPMDPQRFARLAIRQVVRNRSIIVVPARVKSLWYLHRLSPWVVDRILTTLTPSAIDALVRPASTDGGRPTPS